MSEEQQTIQSLYDLLRAVVFKAGGELVLTKDEFMASLGVPLTISHTKDGLTYLRIWGYNVHEEMLAWYERMQQENIGEESKQYYLERAP